MTKDNIDPWTTAAGFVALAVVLILLCIALYNSPYGGGTGWPSPVHWLDWLMKFRG